ncbi:AraC family transcriptional regulator [Acinetobacter sp. 'aerobic (ED)']|uniref:AraC family transcriptional regulator n=1 Tax=Acinetobacter sp. 'aerobic (ED)' TaxID=174230 RepID=UPI00192A972F|nr:AraC family transcriptional regulator [Acinetobacter sp. 'aerobic (ED)']
MYRAIYNVRSANAGLLCMLESFCAKQNIELPLRTANMTPNDRIPFSEWVNLLKHIEKSYSGQCLSLKIAECVKLQNMGILGYICGSCENIREAVQAFLKYYRLAYDSIEIYLKSDEGNLMICWRSEKNFRANSLAVETMVFALIMFIRKLVLPEILSVAKIEFSTKKSKHHKAFSEYFGCPVLFNQDRTAIYFPLSFLDIRIESADKVLNYFLVQYAEELFAKLPDVDTFEILVKNEIIQSLNHGDVLIENVAEKLGYTPRMFQYLLKQHDLNFRKLLIDIRRDLSIKYLSDLTLSVLEVSQLLSYQEQTSFIRAFRSWTGLSPTQYRKKFISSFREDFYSKWDIVC